MYGKFSSTKLYRIYLSLFVLCLLRLCAMEPVAICVHFRRRVLPHLDSFAALPSATDTPVQDGGAQGRGEAQDVEEEQALSEDRVRHQGAGSKTQTG